MIGVVVIIGIIAFISLTLFSEKSEKARFDDVINMVDNKIKHDNIISSPKYKNAMKYDCKINVAGTKDVGNATFLIEIDRVTIASHNGNIQVYLLVKSPSNYCSIGNKKLNPNLPDTLDVIINWINAGASFHLSDGSKIMSLEYDRHNPIYIPV